MTEISKVYSATDITWCAEFEDGRIYCYPKRKFRRATDLDLIIEGYARRNTEITAFAHAALTAIRDHEMALA